MCKVKAWYLHSQTSIDYSMKDAVMSGICLEQITSTFAMFPLHGKVLWDNKDYWKSGGNVNGLPKIPKLIGSNVDFITDIKNHRSFSKQAFQLNLV